VPCQPRPLAPGHHAAGPGRARSPDLVNRDFTSDAPARRCVGDITLHRDVGRMVVLATVIDCATRKVIGWAIDDNYKTPLITAAIEMAAVTGPAFWCGFSFRPGKQIHTSAEFGAVLKGLDIRQSVGRTGICYDNALAESFNAAVKVERVYRTIYPTRRKAAEILRGTSSSRYNRNVSTQRSAIRLRKKVHDEYLNRQLAA